MGRGKKHRHLAPGGCMYVWEYDLRALPREGVFPHKSLVDRLHAVVAACLDPVTGGPNATAKMLSTCPRVHAASPPLRVQARMP